MTSIAGRLVNTRMLNTARVYYYKSSNQSNFEGENQNLSTTNSYCSLNTNTDNSKTTESKQNDEEEKSVFRLLNAEKIIAKRAKIKQRRLHVRNNKKRKKSESILIFS